jgi:selenide,water dikinase
LRQLPKFDDPNLLVGFDTSDDAAVYKIDDNTALIQTVDIFPPVVDDPYSYGQIAAANSLSDVYAMGGKPKLAMNVLCMPEDLDKEIILEILQGGYSKCKEADTIICGGHTIKDHEPKYGLCVSGFVHPDKILKNSTVKEGDVLILTKALGTGILNTAIKADLLEPATEKALIESMATLNKDAALALNDFSISGCTDVTGFGLMGHANEMASGSGRTIVIEGSKVPLLPQAYEMAEMGIVPKGAYNNRNWTSCSVSFGEEVSLALSDVLFDPQTSGGLLISLPETEAQKLIYRLKDTVPVAEIIGYVEKFSGKTVYVK